MDLSFPENESVNSGIQKNVYEGRVTQYSLPAVTDLTDIMVGQGAGAWLWKCDLERAYRQLRVDPLAVPLLGIMHRDKFYLDICPSFGCRTSGYAQQRVSLAISYLMKKRGFVCLAFVDDFAGSEITRERAQRAMMAFHEICTSLGVAIAHDKTVGPTQCLDWLGYTVDSWKMIIEIPEQKIIDIIEEARRWQTKRAATRRELQVLAGRLAHVSGCVIHSRKFMSRILYQLRATPAFAKKIISDETRADIRWFVECARALNGRVLVAPKLTTLQIECDACMTGGVVFLPHIFMILLSPMGGVTATIYRVLRRSILLWQSRRWPSKKRALIGS